jgi:uncharacterized protein (TIGR00730 family)
VGHHGLTELLVVESMHERKLAMSDRADAFIAMPGGVGTLEELFEVLTWTQLGIHHKPVGLLDVGGFFRDLVSFLDRTVDAGFVQPIHRQILSTGTDARRLLADMAAWSPEGTPRARSSRSSGGSWRPPRAASATASSDSERPGRMDTPAADR